MDDPIIFLDIDGVLNRTHDLSDMNETCLANLKKILDETGAKLVISSSWRLGDVKDTVKLLMDTEDQYNLPLVINADNVIGETPRLYLHDEKKRSLGPASRGTEILEYMWQTCGYSINYAIIDDECSEMLYRQYEHVFPCNPNQGLTEQVADKVIAYLNRFEGKKCLKTT